MKFEEFLNAYAEQFPERIQDKDTFVNEVDSITVDYASSNIKFFNRIKDDSGRTTRELLVTGGLGTGFDNDPEYSFLWNNLIISNQSFNSWWDTHDEINNLSDDTSIRIELDRASIDVYTALRFFNESEEELEEESEEEPEEDEEDEPSESTES